MREKKLPLGHGELLELAHKLPTPFYLYDEAAIIDNARAFKRLFSWAPGFTNYFAARRVNPTIVKPWARGLAQTVELRLSSLMPADRGAEHYSTQRYARRWFRPLRAGRAINSTTSHIAALEAMGPFPRPSASATTPGGEDRNAIIRSPSRRSMGYSLDRRLLQGCEGEGAELRLPHHGGEQRADGSYIVETARMLFDLCVRIKEEAGVRIDFIDMGGGIGIPYKPEDEKMDLAAVSRAMEALYEETIKGNGLDPLEIFFECGRVITGPYGYLVSRVLHVTSKYKEYVGLDASMANLMRPALYGSYHHITVLGKDKEKRDHRYDVTGSLCENNDKFAIDRMLPKMEKGDVVVIHDAGAHGHAMGFNYNAKLRSAEYLLRRDGSVDLIRRAQTYDDYVATLRFDGAPVVV